MDAAELKKRISAYEWYHIINVAPGVETPGVKAHVPTQHKVLAVFDQIDFRGKRVLDIGCRDGLFSFEAERRGAAEVIGIDYNLSLGAIEVLIPYFGSKVAMHQMNLLDLKPSDFGAFDIVIFAGVLYHLRYPFWSIKLVQDVMTPEGVMVLETAVVLDDEAEALLYCPTGKDSPYEPSSCTFFNVKALTETLESLGLQPTTTEMVRGGRFPFVARGTLKREVGRMTLLCIRRGVTLDSERSSWSWHQRLIGRQ